MEHTDIKPGDIVTIKDAERIAKARGLDGVIIIGFKAEAFEGCSYGDTKKLCKGYAQILDRFAEAITDGEVTVPRRKG
jgi:hypothetical protein